MLQVQVWMWCLLWLNCHTTKAMPRTTFENLVTVTDHELCKQINHTSCSQTEIMEECPIMCNASLQDHVLCKDLSHTMCSDTKVMEQCPNMCSVSFQVETQISQPPVDTRVILGHVATLQCKVSNAGTGQVQVLWYHGSEIIPDNTQRIDIRQDGTLEIQEARAADAGLYTCQVISSGGNDSRSARLDVIELPYAPTGIIAEENPNLPTSVKLSWTRAFDGNSPLINFIVQRRPAPTDGATDDLGLNWETVLTNVSATSTSAIVRELPASTAYQFRVSAVNNVGVGSPSLPSNNLTLTNTLIPTQEEPSGPPQDLDGLPLSDTEIMIQWEYPSEEERIGEVDGYIVRYRLSGYQDSRWYYRNITGESQRNYVIGGLIIWKEYDIQVATYNIMGVGVYSSSIMIKTMQGRPAAPPRDLEAQAITSTSIQVSWMQPDPSMINGINQGYKLQAWKEHPINASEPYKTGTVLPSPLPHAMESAILVGLDKFTNYYITVLCFTNPGDGIRSDPKLVQTLEDVPGPVSNLTFEDISDRIVTVIWSAPEHQNGILIAYTLTYMVIDAPQTRQTYNLTADTTKYIVEDLSATTYYIIEVYAWTNKGPGEEISATIQSGVEPVLPEPPRLGYIHHAGKDTGYDHGSSHHTGKDKGYGKISTHHGSIHGGKDTGYGKVSTHHGSIHSGKDTGYGKVFTHHGSIHGGKDTGYGKVSTHHGSIHSGKDAGYGKVSTQHGIHAGKDTGYGKVSTHHGSSHHGGKDTGYDDGFIHHAVKDIEYGKGSIHHSGKDTGYGKVSTHHGSSHHGGKDTGYGKVSTHHGSIHAGKDTGYGKVSTHHGSIHGGKDAGYGKVSTQHGIHAGKDTGYGKVSTHHGTSHHGGKDTGYDDGSIHHVKDIEYGKGSIHHTVKDKEYSSIHHAGKGTGYGKGSIHDAVKDKEYGSINHAGKGTGYGKAFTHQGYIHDAVKDKEYGSIHHAGKGTGYGKAFTHHGSIHHAVKDKEYGYPIHHAGKGTGYGKYSIHHSSKDTGYGSPSVTEYGEGSFHHPGKVSEDGYLDY